MIILEHDRNVRFRPDAPELIAAVGTSPKLSGAIEGKSVGPAAGLHKDREFPLRTPFHDAVVGLVGKKDIAPLIACRAFREGKAVSQLLQGFPRRDDFTAGRGGRGGEKRAKQEYKNEFHRDALRHWI